LKSENFSRLRNLRAIAIPASIRQIHRSAFSECQCLSCVTFESPSQCWYVSLSAFSYCRQLESFFLPPSLEVIDSSGFSLSSSPHHFFTSAHSHFYVENDCLLGIADQKLIRYLGDSPTFCVHADISIASEGSFGQNDQFVSGSPWRLKSLSAFAFSHCPHLLSITVPKSVLVIGENCFDGCSELKAVSFEFPATIHRIDCGAFYNCSGLTSFTVPSSVSTLGKSVFQRCGKLLSVTFETPSNLIDIPDYLFMYYSLLTSLCLPDSVITIAASAFLYTSLDSLTARGFSTTGSLFTHFQKVVCC
jgi:hypothetical protein